MSSLLTCSFFRESSDLKPCVCPKLQATLTFSVTQGLHVFTRPDFPPPCAVGNAAGQALLLWGAGEAVLCCHLFSSISGPSFRWYSDKEPSLPVQELQKTQVQSLAWKIPERKQQPTPVFLPGNAMAGGA